MGTYIYFFRFVVNTSNTTKQGKNPKSIKSMRGRVKLLLSLFFFLHNVLPVHTMVCINVYFLYLTLSFSDELFKSLSVSFLQIRIATVSRKRRMILKSSSTRNLRTQACCQKYIRNKQHYESSAPYPWHIAFMQCSR